MWRQIAPAFRVTLFFTVLTGIIYPGAITALCQALFHWQANGSMVEANGHVVGSTLIGQNFTKPEYFQPRPSAAGSDGYDASASYASNYGSTNQKLIDRVTASLEKFHKDNPDFSGPIPADLLTASGSGLDPDVSLASAEAQAARVAARRGVSVDKIRELIAQHAKGRKLGFLGEPRINVLELNLSIDQKFPFE
jgi:potassium-transporting ATPase KdpC subunit